MTWLADLRWRLALWLCPRLDVAIEKRRLERLARGYGLSKTAAVALAGAYFEGLRRG